MINILSHEKLKSIWAEVPTDYYYRLNFFQKQWHDWKWIVIEHLAKKPGKPLASILEVGCASGHLSALLAQSFPQSHVTGVDVYHLAIAEAKKRYPSLTFTVADAQKLPYADNSFDLVVSSETIEHVVSPLTMLVEIKRVLKKDGIAVVEMDSGSFLFRIIWLFWTTLGRGRVWKKAHLHPFTSAELEREIKKAGFTIQEKMFSHLGMAVSFLLRK